MAVKLAQKHIEAIERLLQKSGSPKILIEVDKGKPLISEIKGERVAV